MAFLLDEAKEWEEIAIRCDTNGGRMIMLTIQDEQVRVVMQNMVEKIEIFLASGCFDDKTQDAMRRRNTSIKQILYISQGLRESMAQMKGPPPP